MAWQSIIVGVDGSEESVRAAALGADIARRAGVGCRLVHVANDYTAALAVPEVAIEADDLREAVESSARRLVALSLGDRVSSGLRQSLEVRRGRPAVVLAGLGQAGAADAVVLGTKRRDPLARLAGSTINDLVRLNAVPVLAASGVPSLGRVLVAVDLSAATQPTLEAAERWAELYGARLRVVYAAEPVPVIPGFKQTRDRDAFFRWSQRQAAEVIEPLLSRAETDIVVRPGRAAAAIASEAEQWQADLVVVGSHGKGWVDRLLIGSTSERLLHVLPISLLIVPTAPQHAPLRPGPTPELEPLTS